MPGVIVKTPGSRGGRGRWARDIDARQGTYRDRGTTPDKHDSGDGVVVIDRDVVAPTLDISGQLS
ncbi:hypothetical protein [Mycolicibacterium arseniciresistens]|uniref:Uncharacterized protein n=1 Tax=Mycolicibacterium arseniciresistens TaxID=3062257 RepID=A0ABT8UMZ3_9MYCO|nr:hypothetical protein [Mycolicibacterium arseniciresistens]MDO3638155.1 hypothetical protein [Mycolicibacterium arseniciresistens]